MTENAAIGPFQVHCNVALENHRAEGTARPLPRIMVLIESATVLLFLYHLHPAFSRLPAIDPFVFHFSSRKMFVRSIVVAFVIAASAVSAGNVTLASALHSTPDLSVLRDLSIHFPLIGQYLTSLSNVTILAPSNEAFAAFGNVTALAQSNLPMVQRLLSYHVLNGTHDFASFGTNATFIPTCLVDSASANVTGGQRVSVMKLNGNLAIFSAPGNNSLVTATVGFSASFPVLADFLGY